MGGVATPKPVGGARVSLLEESEPQYAVAPVAPEIPIKLEFPFLR